MRTSPAVLTVALLACNDAPFGPRIDPEAVTIDFAFRVVDRKAPHETKVAGADGEVLIEASVFTGNHGYELQPTLTANGVLELLVVVKSVGAVTIPAHYRYDARIQGLPEGRYRLRVAHQFASHGEKEQVFDGVVRVS